MNQKTIAAAAAVCAAAVAMSAANAEPLDLKTATEADVRAVLDAALAKTNAAEAKAYASTHRLFDAVAHRRDFAALRTEVDDALSAKGVGAWWAHPATFPKMSAIQRERLGANAAYPKTLAVAQRLNCNMFGGNILYNGGTFDDAADWLSEAVAFPTNAPIYSVCHFDGFKQYMQKRATKVVKKYLRSQGRSFVTKDGVNPCEKYMTDLNAALNAPRFAGLDAWLKSLGFKGVDLSALPSEAEVAALREDILNGEKEMTDRNKTILNICLGVDGYNAFVKEYNGED